MQGYSRVGRGRCHRGYDVIEVRDEFVLAKSHFDKYPHEIPKNLITLLPDGQRFCGILWAGGWDEYIVDMTMIRDMTPEEIAEGERNVKEGYGLPPLVGNRGWLRGYFTHGVVANNQCVKIISHLGGGD